MDKNAPQSPYRKGQWTITKLKDELKLRRLPVYGLKEELIERLEDNDTRAPKGRSSSVSGRASSRSRSPARSSSVSPMKVKTVESVIIDTQQQAPRTPRGRKAAGVTSTSQFSALKVSQLQQELRDRGLSPAGKKADLVSRLDESARNGPNPFVAGSASTPSRAKNTRTATTPQSASKTAAAATTSPRAKSPATKSATKQTPSKAVHSPGSSAEPRSPSSAAAASNVKSLSFLCTPLSILQYFILGCAEKVVQAVACMRAKPRPWMISALIVALVSIINCIEGPHQAYLFPLQKAGIWYGHWFVLGVLSSVGLGSGAHTFLLFLGPFIARATTAAYVCSSVDFALSGTDAMLCPKGSYERTVVGLLSIANKVKWEAFAWGAGTAFGELPPFFVARASALAGRISGDMLKIEQIKSKGAGHRTILESLQNCVYNIVHKMGFFGILLCASVPNPLFDLAGLTCGYFMIPFRTFWGATFIGKAIIKAAIQTLFVIFLFSKDNLEKSIDFVKSHFPTLGKPFHEWILEQRTTFQSQTPKVANDLVSSLWHVTMMFMITYFVLTAMKFVAVSYAKKHGLLSAKAKRN